MLRRLALLTVGACLAISAFAATSSSADVTIGANVTQSTVNKGTCGYGDPAERPCLFATAVIAGQTMTSPCNGTVTRFRLNGFVRPANHYRLRVVRQNPDGSVTGTATSDQVAIMTEGVNEYATSLPISANEGIAIDFQDSTEEFGLRWVAGNSATVLAGYFYDFPADGTPAQPTGPATFYYLFNADIACTQPAPPPTGSTPAPPPSNAFTIGKLKKTTLSVDLGSAGTVAVADAGKKGKTKLLKASSATGGPGEVGVQLKLSGAAKAVLKEKGKVKVRASVTFTPTGGTAATQVKALTVKGPKPSK